MPTLRFNDEVGKELPEVINVNSSLLNTVFVKRAPSVARLDHGSTKVGAVVGVHAPPLISQRNDAVDLAVGQP